jgi:hypothetical protein
MDEAERCHQLAILEAGQKRVDGTPEELMQGMGANVLEVSGPDLRRLKQQLTAHEEILSAAQLGTRLRVLISDRSSSRLPGLHNACPTPIGKGYNRCGHLLKMSLSAVPG